MDEITDVIIRVQNCAEKLKLSNCNLKANFSQQETLVNLKEISLNIGKTDSEAETPIL